MARKAKSFEVAFLLLRMLPTAPNRTTVKQLQRRLEGEHNVAYDERSVLRALTDLSGFLPIRCIDDSRPHQYCWERDAKVFDLPIMSPQVALTFVLAEEFLRPVMPVSSLRQLEPHMKRAAEVLTTLHRGGLTTWPDKVRVFGRGQPLIPPKVEPAVLEGVYTALLDDRQVSLRYRKRGAAADQTYVLNPLALVHRGPVSYLIARERDQPEAKHFALHRINWVAVHDEVAQPTPEFDLDRHIAEGHVGFPKGGDKVTLELALDPEAAITLVEAPLSENQTSTSLPDGRTLFRATVANNVDLHGFLKSYGDLLEVLKPEWLRAEMAETARRVARMYADAAGGPIKASGEGRTHAAPPPASSEDATNVPARKPARGSAKV